MTAARTADRLVALDVGGANLKAADGLGWARSVAFPLWQRPAELAAALAALVEERRPERIVATMTGEIADCFPSRAAGVAHIVAALVHVADALGADLAIYSVAGRHTLDSPPPDDPRPVAAGPAAAGRVDVGVAAALVSPAEALRAPLAAAAANWHALARLAASQAPTARSLLVDIGSTTTDIVPLAGGVPVPLARHDADRMLGGELIYTGVERTPLAALVRRLPHRGRLRPIASERFAESRDVWLLLGILPGDPDSRDTADGGPATAEAARVRLARSMLLDPGDLSAVDALLAARRCATVQARLIARGLRQVAERVGWRPTGVVLSGHGTALARRALRHAGWTPAVVSLPDSLGDDVSRGAPAHALARIARGLLP